MHIMKLKSLLSEQTLIIDMHERINYSWDNMKQKEVTKTAIDSIDVAQSVRGFSYNACTRDSCPAYCGSRDS